MSKEFSRVHGYIDDSFHEILDVILLNSLNLSLRVVCKEIFIKHAIILDIFDVDVDILLVGALFNCVVNQLLAGLEVYRTDACRIRLALGVIVVFTNGIPGMPVAKER